MQRKRLVKEIQHLMTNPPEGINIYAPDRMNSLIINMIGPHSTPYEGGLFELEVLIPDKYPFEAPKLQFNTPIYHPNIDTQGRICMDLLKMPPIGGWKPTISLENLIVAVQSLLANPNPDDPLMVEIAEEYKFNKKEFERKAKQFLNNNKMN